ncbi:MAG: hypothetical protein R3B90_17665 [Planctomycetaceae bacterium]
MHSHLTLRHLIQRIVRRREQDQASRRPPDVLLGFIDDVCQVFEPFNGIARAGYECVHGGDRWEVSVFLGGLEACGGPRDGALRPVNFRIDVQAIATLFEQTHSIGWNAISTNDTSTDGAVQESFLTIEGIARGERISLQVHALPPSDAGPALREHLDGRLELV